MKNLELTFLKTKTFYQLSGKIIQEKLIDSRAMLLFYTPEIKITREHGKGILTVVKAAGYHVFVTAL